MNSPSPAPCQNTTTQVDPPVSEEYPAAESMTEGRHQGGEKASLGEFNHSDDLFSKFDFGF